MSKYFYRYLAIATLLAQATSLHSFSDINILDLFIFNKTLKNYFKLIIYLCGCAGSLVPCVGFLWWWQVGATLCGTVRAAHHSGFSRCGARAVSTRASGVAPYGLSACGAQA